MRSKISFCKKTLVQNNIKMYGVIFFIWGIYLFLRYPLQLMQVNGINADRIFSLGEEYFAFIVPAAMGVAFYHFLKTDNGTAFYLSLPATKAQVYFSQFFSGLLLYLTPLLFNILLSLAIGAFRFRDDKIVAWIVNWGIAMILLSFLNYCVSIGIGMITGSIIWHILFVITFYILPLYFSGAADYFSERLLYGFAGSSRVARFFQELNILGKVSVLYGYREITPDFLAFIGIYAAVSFVLAFLLYRYKKMENNRDWIGFGFLKIIFIFGFTLCAVILMTVVLTGIVGVRLHDDVFTFYIGAALGAVLGYIGAAMIAWKTIYLKKAWWGTFLALALTLAVIGLIDADLFGYERRIPAPEEVVSAEVTVRSLDAGMENNLFRLIQMRNDSQKYRYTYEFTETDNIILVEKIHRLAIERRGSGNEDSESDLSFRIRYVLKNGEIVKRDYYNVSIAAQADWEMLSKSTEALRQDYPVLDEVATRDLIGIRVRTEASRAEDSFSGQQMRELLTIIRQEIMTAAQSPETINIHGRGTEQVQILEQIPIRFSLIREKKPKKQEVELTEAEPESTAEAEADLVFYGSAPRLRRWLMENSAKYQEMTDVEALVESVDVYRLSGKEVYNEYYWADELEQAQTEKIATLTERTEIMRYLKSAGICLFPAEDTMILLRVNLKDGVSYLRAMTEADYAAARDFL